MRSLTRHHRCRADAGPAAPPGAALRLIDVDFGNVTVMIRQALQRVDGRLVLVEPKTALSRRTVTIPPPTLGALPAHRVACHDHGTTLRGFLPRGWDHLVASDGTARRVVPVVLVALPGYQGRGSGCWRADAGDGLSFT